MKREEFLIIAGDLKSELNEVNRLQESEGVGNAKTNTEDWGAFLTIYCC